MRTPPPPPRWAEALVALLIRNPVAREGTLGDLREEYESGCIHGSTSRARRHYCRAALGLGATYAWDAARRRMRGRGRSSADAPRRGESFMLTIAQDLRFALRSLSKAYGFTTVAVLTLAFGIGATTAMFGMLEAAFLRPLPYEEPDRLVLAAATFDGGINPAMSAHDFYDYRAQASSLESLSAFAVFTRPLTLSGFDEPERIDALWISWDLFQTLGVSAAAGRHMTAAEGEPGGDDVVIISDRLARGYFATPEAAVGQIMRIAGTPSTVVGVMPAGFHLAFDVDAWLPMRRGGLFADARRFHNWLAVGRLVDGVTLQEAQDEVDAISAQLEAEYPDSNQGKALLLGDMHGSLVAEQSVSLWLLMAAVSLVLLIACGNVANLLLARGSTRRGELAVRAALGASRSRLIRQLLTESALLALIAGITGLAIAVWLQQLILELMPLSILGIEALEVSSTTLAFALFAAVLTSLLFGTVPAFQGAPNDVAGHLKAAGRTTDTRRGARLRSSLVVAQVAVSVVLLVGSGLMLRSLSGLSSVPLGFAPENLVTVELNLNPGDYPEADQVRLFYTELLDQVRSVPGVVGAAMISRLPIRDPGNNIYVYDASKPPVSASESELAFTRNVLPGYFDAMGIPLIAGRAIEASDTLSAPLIIVIDEDLAEDLFPGQDPIGRRMVIDGGEPVTAEVVGVVGAVQVNGLSEGDNATMYFSFAQSTSRSMRLAMRTGSDASGPVASLRDVVRRMDPNLPMDEITTMETHIGDWMSGTRMVTGSLAVFAGIALILAIVGLYGVLAYHVAQRQREIGLRLAVGAPRGRILGWVLQRGMGLVVVGLALGVTVAFFATRLIESLLFGVAETDPTTFAAVSGLFLLVGLAACIVPALRATRVDPIVALSAD